jgi:chemotaxis protein CheX
MDSGSITREDWIIRLDSAVSEVFEMMLARSGGPMDETAAIAEPIAARIRFSGAVDGECLLHASRSVAQLTAEALLGTVSEPEDSMVEDAIGELCNMVAGGWKSKLEGEQAACLISPPTIFNLELDGLAEDREMRVRRFYCFEGNVFGVNLSF